MTLRAKIYPNGEISFSLDRLKPLDPLVDEVGLTLQQRGVKATVANHGVEAAIAFYTDERNSEISGALPGLVKGGLFMQAPSMEDKKKRGNAGITKYSRRLIECGATLIEKTVGKECCSFLTLTFPSEGGDFALKQISRAYNNFQTALIRELESCGLPGLIIGCVEAQPRQSEKLGRFVPHYHLLFQGRGRYSGWAIHKDWFRDTWWRCLVNAGVVPQDGDRSACSGVERVKKSVTSYLGKYLSKAAKVKAEVAANGSEVECPGSWHKISKKMLDAIKKAIKIRRGEAAYDLLEILRGMSADHVKFEYTVYLEDGSGGKFWIGQYYRVRVSSLELILQSCGAASPAD
jgi:hypothetical protein